MPFLNAVVFLVKKNSEVAFPHHGWVLALKGSRDVKHLQLLRGFREMLLDWFSEEVSRAWSPSQMLLAFRNFKLKAENPLALCL